MILERLDCGKAVDADQFQPVGFGDPHDVRRRLPAMADADADRIGRDDLERHRSVGEHLRPIEHDGAGEAGIVARTAAEQLILSLGRDHKLLDQLGRVSGERVRHHQGGAMQRRLLNAAEGRHDLVRRRRRRRVKVASNPEGEANLVALEGKRAGGAFTMGHVGELSGRRRADQNGTGAFRLERQQEPRVVIGGSRENYDGIGYTRELHHDLAAKRSACRRRVRKVGVGSCFFHLRVPWAW